MKANTTPYIGWLGLKYWKKIWKECEIVRSLNSMNSVFERSSATSDYKDVMLHETEKREEISYVKWDVKKFFVVANGKCQWIVNM